LQRKDLPSTHSIDFSAVARSGTVLLVDDEALVLASTAEMLAELGYRLGKAESGREALRREIDVDLLICDHLRPGMIARRWLRRLARRAPL
jgi:CheY-like chemotaxis protein